MPTARQAALLLLAKSRADFLQSVLEDAVKVRTLAPKAVQQVASKQATSWPSLVNHEASGLVQRPPELLDLASDQGREGGVELRAGVEIAIASQRTGLPGIVTNTRTV